MEEIITKEKNHTLEMEYTEMYDRRHILISQTLEDETDTVVLTIKELKDIAFRLRKNYGINLEMI